MESNSSFSKVSNLVMGEDGFQIFQTKEEFDQGKPCFKLDKMTGNADFKVGGIEIKKTLDEVRIDTGDNSVEIIDAKERLDKLEKPMWRRITLDMLEFRSIFSQDLKPEMIWYHYNQDGDAYVHIRVRFTATSIGQLAIGNKNIRNKRNQLLRIFDAEAVLDVDKVGGIKRYRREARWQAVYTKESWPGYMERPCLMVSVTPFAGAGDPLPEYYLDIKLYLRDEK